MADFPPNLDDGEFCLPSDIYPPEFPTIFSSNSTTETTLQFPSELTYMQDLAEQLARENMVPQQTPKLPPNPPQFGPVRPLQNGFGRGGYQYHAAFGRGGARPGFIPVYPVYPVKPHPVQGRARAWPRHQQNPVQDRSVPVRSSTGSARGGGARGTGVFLPRVLVSPDTRKKPFVKRTEQVPPGRNAGKLGIPPPPNRCLPHDWTY
ncbi:hypothetical protein CKAN_02649300 [Cinnamomum micranthum f. kanehirae]|uniref:Uncharacterized protein n=1 Tax=Cinnamomum micranthum f. kanehirae TaxID=337451 RepID=A0A3S4Q097_9MAGN|nr:hypothetical protein CKAN_02649300 [Cinnamomum micranthum f. kanehirae]